MRIETLQSFPMVAMRGVVLFPDTVNHFDVSREASMRAVNYCLDNNEKIFLIAQRDISVEHPKEKDLYRYGVVAEIRQVLKINEDLFRVLVECRFRAKMISVAEKENVVFATV